MTATKFIAGNWKMNGLLSSLSEAQAIAGLSNDSVVNVAIFPPATLIHTLSEKLGAQSPVLLGGQDCHIEASGAYTGDVSAAMLKDAGAKLVLVGHSERRQGHKESSETVARKVKAALKAGLEPMICIGETFEERQGGETEAVLTEQLRDSLPPELDGNVFHVAYEPVWAIGTGLIATDAQIIDAFKLIRTVLDARFGPGKVAFILYGGSVKPDNAGQILSLEGVNGLLVGGASLKAADFGQIIAAAS